jgi:hypothetical protein
MKRALVIGGYGVFGTHICRDLAGRGVPVTVAGRDGARADALARLLGPDARGAALDVADGAACRAALAGHGIAVRCAGPFDHRDRALLEACLDAGCHYADISEDRRYATLVRDHSERFRARNLAAVYGCSSLPGISGALALDARARASRPVERVRVTLFVGNNNPKGEAAVTSLLAGLGRPIAAPQGTLLGFHDREVVPLPPPFGCRGVFNMDGPEYDLFPALLGTRRVSVKVGFELRLVTYGFALLARLGCGYGASTARLLERPSRLFRSLGCSGGAVMTELFLTGGETRRSAMLARHDGQRMVALPCVLVVHAMAEDRVTGRGAMTAYEALRAAPLSAGLVDEGFELHTEGMSGGRVELQR